MSVAERWIPIHSERILNSLINHLFPAIGSRDIQTLKTRDLLLPLRKIEAKGTHETASRLKHRIAAIMRYAVQEDIIENKQANQKDGTLPLQNANIIRFLNLNKYQTC